MSVKQRLIEFIKQDGLSQSRFEKAVGLSNGYVNNISKGIGADKLQRITEKFPYLNAEWLLTGEGEMLKTDTPKSGVSTEEGGVISIPRDAWEVIRNQSASLKAKDEQLGMLAASLKTKDDQINTLISQNKSERDETIRVISILEKELAKKGEDASYPSHVAILADTE